MTPEHIATSLACGYIPAKLVVDVFETHGFPLDEAAAYAARRGLRCDFGGIKHELLMIGMNPRTVDIHIERMRDMWAEESRGVQLVDNSAAKKVVMDILLGGSSE